MHGEGRLVGGGVDDFDGLPAAAGVPLAILEVLVYAARRVHDGGIELSGIAADRHGDQSFAAQCQSFGGRQHDHAQWTRSHRGADFHHATHATWCDQRLTKHAGAQAEGAGSSTDSAYRQNGVLNPPERSFRPAAAAASRCQTTTAVGGCAPRCDLGVITADHDLQLALLTPSAYAWFARNKTEKRQDVCAGMIALRERIAG